MSRTKNMTQPRQRLPYKSKTKEWRKDNVDYGSTHSFYDNAEIRGSLENKIINLNLYNGIVDVRDMKQIINPAGEDATYIPDNVPHHPIIVPKIDLLVGEEINRPFDFSFIVTDSDSITKKVADKTEEYRQSIMQFLEANYSEEQLEQEIAKLDKYMRYTWKDQRELLANKIVKYYYERGGFKEKFSKGFKDALIMGEEIYMLDIINGEPTMNPLNPLTVRAVQSGNSDRIEDSSLIVIEDFKSPNQLVDKYYDELKPADIDALLSNDTSKNGGKGSYTDDANNHLSIFSKFHTFETMMGIAELNGHTFNSNFTDEYGNVRELIVRWKSLRKVFKVKYYDEFGKVQYRFESEEYIPNKNIGEEATPFWLSEGWEGVKLGKDIYIKMKPLSVQYASVDQPYKNHLGVIGQLYNTNQSKPVSLVDRSKNYQYLYNVIWDRLNKAIAANHGKIMEVDLAKIPDGWEVEKWLHFAFVNKIAVLDSFKEGQKGSSTGRLAGSMNTVGGGVIDMETGNYIQQHIQLLEFIKMEMSDILGISKQREGQISNRETVGGVERSVNQSSHITEYWFAKHESVKLRVLEGFLEMAKFALRKEGNKQIQYVLDDQTVETLMITDTGFTESDYGVVATNASKYKNLEEMMMQNAQAFIQNGGSFKTLMDVTFSNSLMDMRRKIEESEAEMQQAQQEAANADREAQAEAIEREYALKEAELQLDYYKVDLDNRTKLEIAMLQQGSGDSTVEKSDDGVVNPLDEAKFRLDVSKAKTEKLLRIQEMSNDMKKHEDDVKLKEKTISAQIRRSNSTK